MKANKMPERVYLFDYNDAMVTPLEGDTTYVREDAFIEKAQDFFRQSHHLFGLDGNELYHFIEDFRRYMEE